MSAPAREPAAKADNSEFTVIRVKRKRSDDAPEDLAVAGLLPQGKRAHTSLSDALGEMGLKTEDGVANSRLRRFRKAATMSGAQLSAMDAAQLQALLAVPPAACPAGDDEPVAAPASSAEPGGAGPRDGPRYEQVPRRRGLTNFERTEAAADPLREIAGLYDVVCMASGSRWGAAQEASRHGPAELAPPPPEDGTVLCNGMAMVRERAEPTAAGGGATIGVPGSDADMQDDYVYDLYIAAAGGGEAEQDAEADAVRWWELHRAGLAPVVRLAADDAWLVSEMDDQEDDDADSQDSNAEGFFANDYPDGTESGSGEDSELDGSWDEWSAYGSEESLPRLLRRV